MSVRTFRLCLVGLALLAVGIVAASIVPTLLVDRDGWSGFRPVVIDADPLIAQPADILTARDRESIRGVVADTEENDEARRFGIPWSVAVVRDTEIEPGIEPESYVEALFADVEIESQEGADDGLLMAVVIPDGNHTETTVHFVTGEEFYPRGGITPERLRWIADVQMAPMIADNTIGDAIIEGAMWVEWMQLFEPPPNPSPTLLQTGLRELLHPLGAVALGTLAIAIAGAAITVALVTRRAGALAESMPLDATEASALRIGRVDHRVVAGVALDAIDRGVMVDSSDGLELATQLGARQRGRYDARLAQAMHSMSQQNVTVSFDRLVRHLHNVDLPQAMEDELARGGLMHPRSHLFQLWLRGAAVAGTLLGIICLVLAVLGEVESALATAITLTIMSVIVLIWNESRSWTSRAGQAALTQWLIEHPQPMDRNRRLYDTVIRLDDVGSPTSRTLTMQAET